MDRRFVWFESRRYAGMIFLSRTHRCTRRGTCITAWCEPSWNTISIPPHDWTSMLSDHRHLWHTPLPNYWCPACGSDHSFMCPVCLVFGLSSLNERVLGQHVAWANDPAGQCRVHCLLCDPVIVSRFRNSIHICDVIVSINRFSSNLLGVPHMWCHCQYK